MESSISDDLPVLPPAPFGLRLLAKFADLLIVNFAQVLLVIAFAVLQTLGISGVRLIEWLGIILVVLLIGYFALLTTGGRRSPGYRLAGLLVVRDVPPGQLAVLGFGRALGRSTLGLVGQGLTGCGVGLLDFLPIAFTRPKRTLHGLATGSRVVRVSPPRYAALVSCALGSFTVALVGVFSVIKPVFCETYYTDSVGMAPTIPKGGKVISNKIYYRFHKPERGDLVSALCFHAHEEPIIIVTNHSQA